MNTSDEILIPNDYYWIMKNDGFFIWELYQWEEWRQTFTDNHEDETTVSKSDVLFYRHIIPPREMPR